MIKVMPTREICSNSIFKEQKYAIYWPSGAMRIGEFKTSEAAEKRMKWLAPYVDGTCFVDVQDEE